MPRCEKCWREAAFVALVSNTDEHDEYARLLRERKDNPCTPDEQRGENETEEPR